MPGGATFPGWNEAEKFTFVCGPKIWRGATSSLSSSSLCADSAAEGLQPNWERAGVMWGEKLGGPQGKSHWTLRRGCFGALLLQDGDVLEALVCLSALRSLPALRALLQGTAVQTLMKDCRSYLCY